MRLVEHVYLMRRLLSPLLSLLGLLLRLLLLGLALEGGAGGDELPFGGGFGGQGDGGGVLLGEVSPPHALAAVLLASVFLDFAVSVEFDFVGESVGAVDTQGIELVAHGEGIDGVVVLLAEVDENVGEVDVFFLHLLVVAPALLGLAGADEKLHGLEYFVGPAHVAVDEVLVVDFEEPVIPLVLLGEPVPVILLLDVLFALLPPPGGFLGVVGPPAAPAVGRGKGILLRGGLALHIRILHIPLVEVAQLEKVVVEEGVFERWLLHAFDIQPMRV